MIANRRSFLQGALAAAGLATSRAASAQHQHEPARTPPSGLARGVAAQSVGVQSPDVPHLPFVVENGTKVFRLVAEPVRTEFLPGRPVDAWGFNGSMPGPTVEVNEGDHVRFVVENRLPEPFSMHWHGLEIPIGMDGGPGISQAPIEPGDTFVYEFPLHQNGTFFYHSHMAMQELMGMIGLFVIHPRKAHEPRVDRDFGLIFQGWAILPNNTVPNTLAMEFNWLTINGKAGPATTPMLVRRGERVRIRIVNLSMDHHPIHLHGNTFQTTGTEAGRIPESAWQPGNTVLVGVAQARDVEFVAANPGDWMLHCHLPHHMMNQMSSMVGPLMTGEGRLRTGLGFEEGMGIVRGAHALSNDLGPGLGRGLGVAATRERAVTNQALGAGIHIGHASIPPGATSVPGFPQDMWMTMDELVAKPETYGLKPTWSGGMMGMMTLVRVLEPDLFDHIERLKAERAGEVR